MAHKELVAELDAMAADLIKKAKNIKVSLETRLVVFDRVARYAQGRNRIEVNDDGSGLLDAYKSTIDAAQSEVTQRESNNRRNNTKYLGRLGRAAVVRGTGNGDGENGGAALEALKSRLPAADEHNVDGHRGGGSGQIAVDAGPVRVIRPELPGNTDTVFDEPHGGDEF